jgi:hypothetical protein
VEPGRQFHPPQPSFCAGVGAGRYTKESDLPLPWPAALVRLRGVKGLAAVCLGLLLASACGGSSFGGRGNEGGSNGQGGSSTHAGSTGKGGSTAKAGTSSTGGDCANVLCARLAAPPLCEGELVIQPGQCCPTCSCDAIDCAYPVCEDGAEPVVEPGRCCPTCPPPQPSCAAVQCQPVMDCGPSHMLAKPPGACCEGCIPTMPGGVSCTLLPCPDGNPCPAGYVRGDVLGGCCNDCLPDPLYCSSAADCVVADKPRSCCGCPEPISIRQYNDDPCWSAPDSPRPIPEECFPDAMCGAVCGACPPAGQASCFENRCTVLAK